MAASPLPPKALSAGGGDHISLFLDTDLGTHLALNVATDSTIRGLKSQVAVEHAAAFPDLGPVAVKSFQVLRKGAMYHLSDSMVVRSAFAKVKAGYFLHVNMAALETDTHYCRDEDRGKSSERFGELPALDDLSREKDRKKARVTGSFDTSAVDPIGETNDSKTRDVENFDKLPLETNINSREMLSNTSFQQEVNGNINEDSIQLENSIPTRKNKKRKKSRLVTSKDVSASEMTEPSTGAVEVPKAIGEDPRHENQGLQGDGASKVEMTNREKTKVIPPDTFLSSSQLNSGSQVTKHVQLGTDSQATKDLSADQSNINPVHEWYRNPIVRDISITTCKVVAGEDKSAKGTNDGVNDESAVDGINMEKGSKSGDVLETLDNISQNKNCNQSKKVSSVGLTSMDTAEAKDQCGYGEKAGKSDIISTQQEIVNDPSKRQTSSVQQGIEKPNGDVKRKKKRRQHTESSKDDPTQGAEKPSGVIMNASSTQDTSSHCLNANQITLDNIGEETGDEKDHCKREKVSTQGVSVNDPSNVQQGDSDVIKNPNGDGKQKKKKRRLLESSKDDPTQDVTKSSGLITNGSSIQNRSADPLNAEQTTTGTVGEATVNDCRKVDETVDVSTANVINEVLADLRCTDSLSKVLNRDPLTEQTKGGASAALPPPAIQSDPPISLPSHKSKGKPVKIPSTVLDPSHSSVDVPEENAYTELRESDTLRCSDKICDHENVLAESTVVAAANRTKSTKRQRNKVSLKHVPTDIGKAIQSLGEQVGHVPAEELKGENYAKAELFQGGTAVDAPISTGQILHKKTKRSSKAQAPKIEEVEHSTHGHENQFAKDNQDKYVTDICGTHNNGNAVGAPAESPVVHKDGTTVTCDKPNARKARKKSAKTELRRQDTNLDHGADANFMNSRAQQGADPEAVEPIDYVPVQPDNEKINFIDHFSPSATNGQSVSAKNNDETLKEVKGKKESKRKADTQSQHAGSIEPNDVPESHVHTDKTSLADHFGTDNVGMPSISAENMNKEDGNVKKAKGKKKNKLKPDLIKPESLNPNGGNQDTVNRTQDLMHSDVQKGRMEQGNAKQSNDNVIQNDSMLQQETEYATHDSTLERKAPQSMVGVDTLTNFPIEKDHARMSKEQRNSISQTKPHAKTRKHDGSTDGRTSTNPNVVSNVVQSFPMSPQASNESTYGTPAVKQFRVAIRKVPRKNEQAKDKPKNDISKRRTGGIFGDNISESSDEVLNTMSEKAAIANSLSTSADSGVSSAAWDESDVPDDDVIASLSQKSDLNSVLRGSTSYKKARLKPVELLDDNEVPDSQPPDV